MSAIKAAVLHAKNDLRIEEIARTDTSEGCARVRVDAVGVCGSDTHYLIHGRIGEFVLNGPIVLGHEPAGTVVEVGTGVTKVHVGDRVSIEPGRPCGRCERCRKGEYNVCPDMAFMATPPYDGAFAHSIVWHEDYLHVLPDSLSLEEGALCEPMSVGLWANERANVGIDDEVLVSGGGPVGLLAAEVARARGARRVVVRDIDTDRLALAQAHGHETEVVGPGDEPQSMKGEVGAEFSVLLECSGAPGAMAGCLARLRSRGRAVMIGLPVDDPQLPLARLHHRELTVMNIFRYVNTWPTAIRLMSEGKVDVSGIFTHHFGLQQTKQALLAASQIEGCFKAIVYPQIDKIADPSAAFRLGEATA
jgi:L-iditol 2-dehydrogenase